MVVAALVSAYAPSSRGIFRHKSRLNVEVSADSEIAARRRWDVALSGVTALTAGQEGGGANVGGGRGGEESTVGTGNMTGNVDKPAAHDPADGSERFQPDGPSTTHRKKRLKAMAALTSFASDFDVLADWYYWYSMYQMEKEFEEEGVNMIPPYLLNSLLASCIMGTIMWAILATDGRVVMPLLRPLGIEGVSTGYVLLLSVLLEDLPQVVLTSLLDDYILDDQTFSSVAVFNLCTSVYDAMIKLAEAFDERHDVVETGAWCKATYRGHKKAVSSLAILPRNITKEYLSPTLDKSFDDETHTTTGHPPSPGSIGCARRWTWTRQPVETPSWVKQSTRAETMARKTSPPFLTGSYDGTVRLWDPSCYRPCRKTIKCHSDRVTSVCILGTNVGFASLLSYINDDATTNMGCPSSKSFGSFGSTDDHNSSYARQKGRFGAKEKINDEAKNDVYFLTGSRDGTIKLWCLSRKKALKTYEVDNDGHSENTEAAGLRGCAKARPSGTQHLEAVTSLLTLDTSTASHFVSGHRNASARVWDAATGDCLRIYRGEHTGWVTSLCGIGDEGRTFVTGSDDATAKLWDAKKALVGSGSSSTLMGCNSRILGDDSFAEPGGWGFSRSGLGPGRETRTSRSPAVPGTVWAGNQSITGVPKHKDTGLVPAMPTVTEAESDTSLYSPSDEEVPSVRTFSGHSGAIFSVASVEPTKTIVTGSADRTAKIWSIETGSCLSTLSGHLGAVSSVAAFDSTAILTGSFDRTAKLWDVSSGACIRTFDDHGRYITALAPCGNGRTFVTTSYDGTARLWTVTTANIAPNLQRLIEEAEEEYYEGHGGGVGVLLS